VQLTTTPDEQAAIDLIRQNNFGAGAAYFRRSLNGRSAYTVIYGVFESRDPAQNALAALPPGIRKSKPWVRRFSEVQALLQPQKPVLTTLDR